MVKVPTVEYKVRKDDNLTNIVKGAGFPAKDWKRVYDAPYNAPLRKSRPDPNVIQAGDIVLLPKYPPSAVQEILQRIKSTEAALQKVVTQRTRLQSQLEVLLRAQSVDKKKLAKLKKEADSLESIGDAAANECSDMYSCMGAGMVAQKFYWQSKSVREEMTQLERNIQGKGREKAITRINRFMKQTTKDEKRAASDIARLQREFKQASVSPY